MRPQYTSLAAALPALVALAAVSACGDKASKDAAGAPAREIQLPPSAPAQPQLNDAPPAKAAAPEKAREARVAKTPPPEPKVIVRPLTAQDNPAAASPAPAAAPTPAPVAAAPAPAPAPTVGTVSAGTSFAVHPVARVCTNTFKPGDRFTATLAESVSGSDGAVIPAGSSVVLRVDEAVRSIHSRDTLKLTFSPVSLRIGEQSYDLAGHVSQTAPLEKVRVQTTGDQVKKVGAGALIGALAGQLLGKNTRSTVIGAGVGAAAGAAVAAGTTDYDGCVPATANLMVGLDAPLRIKLLPN